MSDSKREKLETLLKNFIDTEKYLEIAFIISKNGQLIAKKERSENKNKLIDTIIPKNLIDKILLQLKGFPRYGSGSFDSKEFRICYFEAGNEAVLFCICDFYINFDDFFPIAYVVAEKIAQIIEDTFNNEYDSLTIPILHSHDSFTLGISRYKKPQNGINKFSNVYHIRHSRKKNMFKIIILGAEGVGKTTLISSFLEKKRTLDYRPTIGVAISSKEYFIQGIKENSVQLIIYDLAGQKFFRRVRKDYYQGADCVVIIYDITNEATLNEAYDIWYKDAKSELGNALYVLIGNKIDLKEKRKVPKEKGAELAEKMQAFFIETSALKNINVRDIFSLISVRLFLKKSL